MRHRGFASKYFEVGQLGGGSRGNKPGQELVIVEGEGCHGIFYTCCGYLLLVAYRHRT